MVKLTLIVAFALVVAGMFLIGQGIGAALAFGAVQDETRGAEYLDGTLLGEHMVAMTPLLTQRQNQGPPYDEVFLSDAYIMPEGELELQFGSMVFLKGGVPERDCTYSTECIITSYKETGEAAFEEEFPCNEIDNSFKWDNTIFPANSFVFSRVTYTYAGMSCAIPTAGVESFFLIVDPIYISTTTVPTADVPDVEGNVTTVVNPDGTTTITTVDPDTGITVVVIQDPITDVSSISITDPQAFVEEVDYLRMALGGLLMIGGTVIGTKIK